MKPKILMAVLVALMLVTLGYPVSHRQQTPTPLSCRLWRPGYPRSRIAYDTASGELIHQLYDNLVAYGKGSRHTAYALHRGSVS